MWINNFVTGCWSHYDWLLNINYLLLLDWSIDHVTLLLHIDRLRLHYVSDWLSTWHGNHLGLLLWLLLRSSFLSSSLGLLLLNDLLLVGLQVTREVELGEETALAVLTSEPLLSLMDFHMLVKVCLLSEGVSAICETAFVWSLLSVDSQMVEEVVPFPEHLSAIGVSAAEESNDSSSLWAFVLIDDEVLSAWDVLLDSDLVEIEILSMGNGDCLIVKDDFPIDELSIDIEVELLLDLSLGKILRGSFLSPLANNFI